MLCPKCHQPLEDTDEAYICCAATQVAWRCQDCAKVSEGFAFPYGLCPYCNGSLERVADRAVADDEGLAAIRRAFEIELGGQAFYSRAARDAKDQAMRELFGHFAEMEKEHMETLARRYHATVPAPSAAFSVERAAIFAGLDTRPDDPGDLFRIAIAFEERAVRFFTERSDMAAGGAAERQLYRELAAEEREHVALLTTEYARWREGKPGLL
jgi:rubrerythrin